MKSPKWYVMVPIWFSSCFVGGVLGNWTAHHMGKRYPKSTITRWEEGKGQVYDSITKIHVATIYSASGSTDGPKYGFYAACDLGLGINTLDSSSANIWVLKHCEVK